MKLKELLKGIEIEKFSGRNSIDIKGLQCDSKRVRPGDLFIALRGTKFDGHDFIEEAIERGASCLVVEDCNCNNCRGALRLPYYYNLQKEVAASIVEVKDTRKILSELVKSFYSKAIKDIKLVGVTGTNGKTTITYLLESILKSSGTRCGVIGTINYRFLDRIIPAQNTTPGILDIYNLLDQMRKDNIDYCVLEVSSHSLDQGRIDGLLFNSGIFANLTPEHLDYHKTLKDYLDAKVKLFRQVKGDGYSIINIDDAFSGEVIGQVLKRGLKLLTFGIKNKADAMAEDINESIKGLAFRVDFCGKKFKISSPLIGLHNVYNILAAFCCAYSLALDFSKIVEGIERLSFVPGRLEKIDSPQGFFIFVDYAHTEDGLKNALLSLRKLCKKKLRVVFGCGGERDRTKRPLMGRLAATLADRVFITSDNPRGEDPETIASEIVNGIPQDKKNFEVIIDREQAIKTAVSESTEEDILLIAGKGHEVFQIFKDRAVPFDDREIVRRILEGTRQWQILEPKRF